MYILSLLSTSSNCDQMLHIFFQEMPLFLSPENTTPNHPLPQLRFPTSAQLHKASELIRSVFIGVARSTGVGRNLVWV